MLKVYNSLSKKHEQFAPANPPKVTMYVCGVTVYDFCHLGHARTYAAFDTIRRYLQKSGYEVEFVQNVTDVDDKIIRRAKEKGEDPLALAEEFDRKSREDFALLGIEQADAYPKVTGNIQEIIKFISGIIESGNAYVNDTGVYFEIAKFKGYGRLSGQDMEMIKRGARIEVDEQKKDPADFALWKKTGEGELGWESPWGRGRPGWHIECSTMSKKHIHGTIDIHGGARDLIFPHHENEIAQSESYDGVKFVKYWLHTGFLTVNGEKMAKSLGNFVTIRDALGKFEPEAVRWFFAQTHYRSPIDYSETEVSKSAVALKRVKNSIEELGAFAKSGSGKAGSADSAFRKELGALEARAMERMDEDFDTSGALAAFNDALRLANQKIREPGFSDYEYAAKAGEFFSSFLALFSISGKAEAGEKIVRTESGKKVRFSGKVDKKALVGFAVKAGIKADEAQDATAIVLAILKAREAARKEKNYALADSIRDFLNKNGIEVEDR